MMQKHHVMDMVQPVRCSDEVIVRFEMVVLSFASSSLDVHEKP